MRYDFEATSTGAPRCFRLPERSESGGPETPSSDRLLQRQE